MKVMRICQNLYGKSREITLVELIFGRFLLFRVTLGRWTDTKIWAPSWNYSISTNQITELHVKKIVSANKNAQNIYFNRYHNDIKDTMFPGYISINHLWSKFESGQGGAGYCLVCLLSSIINIYILEPTTSTPPIIPITPIIIATSTALIICSKLWLGFVLNCSLSSVRRLRQRHLKYYRLKKNLVVL